MGSRTVGDKHQDNLPDLSLSQPLGSPFPPPFLDDEGNARVFYPLDDNILRRPLLLTIVSAYVRPRRSTAYLSPCRTHHGRRPHRVLSFRRTVLSSNSAEAVFPPSRWTAGWQRSSPFYYPHMHGVVELPYYRESWTSGELTNGAPSSASRWSRLSSGGWMVGK